MFINMVGIKYMKKKRKRKKNLLGRDPTMGRVSFKSGVILTPKDKKNNRKSKIYKRILDQEKEDISNDTESYSI